MMKRSLCQPFLLAWLVIVAAICVAAPSLAAGHHPHQPRVYANLQDTGRTVALSVGEELIVGVPLRPYDDNTWYIARNYGGFLKLIAGPDERRRRNWAPWKNSTQLFYFRREAPGTAHLVLEQEYWSKPMILKVVDAPSPPPPSPHPSPLVAPPPVKQKMVLRSVHFDFDKSNIRPGDAAVLDEAATSLKANPSVTINVNGYCDAIGTEEYNLKLSDRRADAVVNYLVKAGIPSNQLIPHGYGKTNFIAGNNTEEGRAQNRRVELVPSE